MTDHLLNVTVCPYDGAHMKTKDSRPSDTYGFPSTRRRKVCPRCGYRVKTIELTEALAQLADLPDLIREIGEEDT